MAALEDPLGLMYAILHQFCTALVMDTLFRQIKVLQGGRWRDAIKHEKLSDTRIGATSCCRTGNCRTSCWCRCGRGIGVWRCIKPTRVSRSEDCILAGSTKGEACTSLRIEHGADQQITCSHSPPVIDSSTGLEAEFVIDSSCINVEKLLLRAIACSIHTRLLEVQRGLKGGVHLWQSDNDVVLRHSIPADLESSSEASTEDENVGEVGEEVLCVRAFGVSYMALGISIRNGRFLLRCPSTVLAAAMVKEIEDALNLATVQPLDLFVTLRTKCLLLCFGLIGRSFNLKRYERGASALKIPVGGPMIGGDVLIMGFPQCEDCFFLCPT